MTFGEQTSRSIAPVIRGLDSAQPLINRGVRLWVAYAFWRSGVASPHD